MMSAWISKQFGHVGRRLQSRPCGTRRISESGSRNRQIPRGTRALRLCVAIAAIHVAGAVCVSSDLTSTSALSIDRGLQQPLATARSLIVRGQFAEAIRSLQPVLGASQNTLVLLDGRYIDAKVAANRLIASFRPRAHTLYEREFGGLARRKLERAQAAGRIDQNPRRFSDLPSHRGGPASSGRCRRTLLRWRPIHRGGRRRTRIARDAGEAAQESAAAARLVTAWLKLGQVDSAQQWVERRHEFLSRHDIEIQGTKHPLDQWLLERIRQQAAGARGGGIRRQRRPSADRRIGPFRRPSARAIWNKRFEVSGVVASLAQELISRRVESGIPPVFHPVPLIVGQTLVTRRSDELAAYDLHGGETRWSIDLSPSGNGSLESETLADRAFSGGPQCAFRLMASGSSRSSKTP